MWSHCYDPLFIVCRFVFYVNGASVVTDVTANDGMWHHIVVTWSNRYGYWQIYKDGVIQDQNAGLAIGATIAGVFSYTFVIFY